MRRILYVSTMSSPMGDAELEAILEVARAHNDAQAITGLLLVIDDVFIQVLEGAGDTLNQLVAKIGDDPRHRDMTIVSDIVIETRDFSGWSMGFERMSLSRLIRANRASRISQEWRMFLRSPASAISLWT
ncbi:MAG: BLUF domain-containing protein [Rhodospirillaceae bacterium]|nr:BLUF domain-containing protein [Rhodospirillaceae bacterium]MBT3909312.1 BLUF domain-containing protein [Rhodospirillaceae bacterium]MBT5515916.1 BLUF domain-containing protein [Rhodospirillaceae bacterium]MBT6086345.1 BLUF domain-containing protein [Rhodospirillaceae bacterium]MBT6607033.1 BLUF domain-containing protein [Rhodospirillaceae bacterium]